MASNLNFEKVYLCSWAGYGYTWVLAEHSVRNIVAVVAKNEEELFKKLMTNPTFLFEVLQVYTPLDKRDSNYDPVPEEDEYTLQAIERIKTDRKYFLKLMEKAKQKDKFEYYTLHQVLEKQLDSPHAH